VGKLLIALRIPLTSYDVAFKVFEVKVVPIRVPNSELDSLLEVPHQYVTIHEESGVLIALSEEEAKEVATSGHFFIRNPVVRVNTDRSCTMAIYKNDAKQAKQLCKYVARHTSRFPLWNVWILT